MKTDMEGKVVTQKAKLGEKVINKVNVIDYDETCSPVAMVKSIQIFLAIITHYENEFLANGCKDNFPQKEI